MVHETRIGKATIVRNLVLAVGFGGMAVNAAALDPRIRSIPSSPHWDEVEL